MSRSNLLKRIIALVAILATVFLIHFSNEYLSEHVSHHCTDHAHCPVCSVIEQCENNIRTVGTGLILAIVAVMAYIVVTDSIANFEYQSVQTTLVSQKVRMDD